MRTGTYISGIGHAGLITVLLFGGMFQTEDDLPPEDVSQVSLLSEAQFAELRSPETSPDATSDAPSVEAPEPADIPVQPTPDTEPTVSALVPEPRPVEPDPVPTPPEPTPVVEAQIEPPAEPEAPETPAETAPPAPSTIERVAPVPVAPSEPELDVADVAVDATSPTPSETPDPVEETPAAPEAAVTVLQPEVNIIEVPAPSANAPSRSRVPTARPANLRLEQPEPAVAESAPSQLDILAALTEAQSEDDGAPEAAGQSEPSSAPEGPPLTGGERDALRVAISSCWNIGTSSTEAQRTTVVVGMDMTPEAKPSNIRLISSNGATESATNIAYEAARRAILRCQTKIDLPAEKYETWREIEITFNPEKMRLR